jgi:hypothetical protein
LHPNLLGDFKIQGNDVPFVEMNAIEKGYKLPKNVHDTS